MMIPSHGTGQGALPREGYQRKSRQTGLVQDISQQFVPRTENHQRKSQDPKPVPTTNPLGQSVVPRTEKPQRKSQQTGLVKDISQEFVPCFENSQRKSQQPVPISNNIPIGQNQTVPISPSISTSQSMVPRTEVS